MIQARLLSYVMSVPSLHYRELYLDYDRDSESTFTLTGEERRHFICVLLLSRETIGLISHGRVATSKPGYNDIRRRFPVDQCLLERTGYSALGRIRVGVVVNRSGWG